MEQGELQIKFTVDCKRFLFLNLVDEAFIVSEKHTHSHG